MDKPWDLRKRMIQFTVSVIRFCRTLAGNPEAWDICRQLRRAASSIGAHYCAAKRNKSDDDYINKISGGIEEGDETLYWFDVLVEAGIASPDAVAPLRSEADELVSILVKSKSTAVSRREMNRAQHKNRSGN